MASRRSKVTSFLADGIISASSSRRDASASVPKYRGTRRGTDNGKSSGTASRSIQSFIILSVVEGRGSARGEIGFASMDALCSQMNISQFIDSASYARLRVMLQVLDPVEVIVPDIAIDKGNSKNAIVELIYSSFPGVEITTVSRRYFNDLRGAELIQQLGSAESSNFTPDILNKYYCMAAAAALVKYVEYIQNVLFAQSSLRIMYYTMDKTCFIDLNTLRNVEVVEKNQLGVKEQNRSLFSVLNTCMTGGGVRMLRSCLLQPSADIDLINARCDAIEELLSNQSKLERLRAVVSSACDVQQLVTVCCYLSTTLDNVRYTEQKISEILNLRRTILLIEPLKVALETSSSQIFKTCYELGQHVMVDLARTAYEELVHDVEEKAEEEIADLPGARLVFTVQRGFHLLVPCMDPISPVELPPQFIQPVRNRTSVSCTTRSLIKYNDRINETVNEIMIGSNIVIVQLIEEIRSSIACLYHLIEVISLIDFLLCLAAYAAKVSTVRPTFSGSHAMVVKQGRHPLLDFATQDAVANDTYLSPESRLAIITGPNMAGKSTYLKQLCLLQILAQTGSFVPADFAGFPLMTHIFARIGHNDDLTNNLSAFALEMSEMVSVLASADSSSLIVIDELARSTATEEGIALCYAICEHLLKTEAFTVFATHFLDLTSLAARYAAVDNYHFTATPVTFESRDGAHNETLKTNHRLYKGPYRGPLYGFNIVELSTFPREVITNAREMAENLRLSKEAANVMSDEVRKRRAYLRFAYKLRSMIPVLRKSDPSAASNYLKSLRKQLLEEMPDRSAVPVASEEQCMEEDEAEG